VASYSFNEGSGTVANDGSGNNNTGTITDATWSTAGKYGDAIKLNGATDSFVTVPDAPSLELTTGMTLEAWVNPSTLNSPDSNWVSAISKENRSDKGNDVVYGLYAAAGTKTPPEVDILVRGTVYSATGTSIVPLNKWTFLAATYDGKTLALYVNGKLVDTTGITGSITTSPDPLRLGGDWSGEMLTGLLDNVRIYNNALSRSQIQTDMRTPLASSRSPTPSFVVPSQGINGSTSASFPGNRVRTIGGIGPVPDGGVAVPSREPSLRIENLPSREAPFQSTPTVVNRRGGHPASIRVRRLDRPSMSDGVLENLE
jgi:hypothetical protein